MKDNKVSGKFFTWLLAGAIGSGCPSLLFGQDFTLEKLPEAVNSVYDEITPVPSRDGRTLFFTRVGCPDFEHTLILDSVNLGERLSGRAFEAKLGSIYSEIKRGAVEDPIGSKFNQDVWIAGFDSSKLLEVSHPGFPLNNALPNSLVATTPNPNEFYIINQFLPDGGMKRGFSSIRREGNSWQFPEAVEIADFYTITSDVSLTMSFDGEVLILSAARFDSRDMDLYVCFKTGEGKFSAPQNLGTTVNSAFRETTPYLSEDNSTLFFSSNNPNSLGGNDIFITRRQDITWKNWTTPVRLSEPVNSTADDSQPYFNISTGYLYFTSKRDGNSDIFRIQLAPPQPSEMEVVGRVINGKTGEVVRDANVEYRIGEGKVSSLKTMDGNYALKIPKGVQAVLACSKVGYARGKEEALFFAREKFKFQNKYFVDLILEPLEVNSKIELAPIFFLQSKAIILEKSIPELERLKGILLENPGLCIRVEGHTDNNGKPEELLRLSEQRAQAVRDFLLKNGIDGKRVEAVGRGSAFPISDNSTDELRQRNRRVEFIITKNRF